MHCPIDSCFFQFQSTSKAVETLIDENSPEDFWIKEDCEKIISEAEELIEATEDNFGQLEAEADYIMDQLASFKEQGPDTATSRQQIKSLVTDSAETREKLSANYHKWKENMQKYMEILTTENEIRSLIVDIESTFSQLAQTLHQDLTAGSSDFRSVFTAKEPRTRVSYFNFDSTIFKK